ncbi:MAG: TIR domain-containing protein [Sphingomonas sp.]|nr:TIR domain-containing protein [Sphingomonas sp.]
MADVFISYARDDQAVAARVAKGLQSAGFDVWWDADLPAHRSYSEVIERNLEEAKAVVVLWSKTAAKSQWVRAEADFARNAGKLVQAAVDGSIPPLPFNQIQCADLKSWRGAASHAGWSKLVGSVQALVSEEEKPAAPAGLPLWDRVKASRWVLAATFALVLLAFAAVLFVVRPGEEKKPVLAVLPFRSISAQDASLVSGIWEDTRTAIGRNPQLVVLGPNTAQQLADKGEDAARKAADYLLEASVRTAGDKIRVSADLVRTKDGQQVWSKDFDRKLDDVFALQSEIASEIEGRIRGRLAEKGGVMPEHIATSGDVYALYSDARAKIRKRDGNLIPAAHQELQQVIKADPNYAPAWAAMAQVEGMIAPSQKDWDLTDHAVEYARRAVDLAPNLAAGHAALALALGLKGPVAKAELQRAIELDPNDFEAITWVGNMANDEGRKRDAIDAYTRAATIEPLFWPAVLNKYNSLKDLNDQAGIASLIEQERKLGADYFGTAIRMDQASSSGAIGDSVNLGLRYWASGKTEGREVVSLNLGGDLLRLGFDDLGWKTGPGPAFAPYLWRNDPAGLDMVEQHASTRVLFSISPLCENVGRVSLVTGRSAQYAQKYISLALTPESFADLGDHGHFVSCAPVVALALRNNGHTDVAGPLLALAEEKGRDGLKDPAPINSVLLARVYAVAGKKDEALSLLASAIGRGWLTEPPMIQPDLYLDPTLASLKGDPRFEQLRQQLLSTLARERAKVDLALVKKVEAAQS